MKIRIVRVGDETYNVYIDDELKAENVSHADALATRKASLDASLELIPLEDEYE